VRPGRGVTRVEADFLDISTHTWMFRRSWDVSPGTTITFNPKAVGSWRLRAEFFGTDTAAPSRSEYRGLIVATPAGQLSLQT
jgi:hypothetical protein